MNVIDSNFVMINDASERLKDITEIYKTLFETEAIDLINKYGVDYIIFSPRISSEMEIDKISYIDSDCFDLVFNKSVLIFESLCVLE